ncbi:rac GTPase-activating protein 1 [Nilaparvata lugens]|uniref:rac GTPase-activating protein 1 n=1 Tax=Nilaparvata lugens TaxID=108931 RepID=UPI00193D3154|nr:rac GTPase-activating protein 1 [Nilaparvata lugens]
MTCIEIESENHNDTITGFYDFVLGFDNMRMRWLESEKKTRKLEVEMKALEKEKQDLENKLKIARRIHDNSISMRKKAEEEKLSLEIQLQQVRDLLFCDTRNKIHDETREKLQSLSTSFMSRTSLDRMDYNAGGDKLTTIDEFESTGSILSDLSYSRSEDDLDINESRRMRKRSYAYNENNGGKRRSVSKRSFASLQAGPGEMLVSTTRVAVSPSGQPVAATVSHTLRSYTSPQTTATVVAPQSETTPSAPKPDSDPDDTPEPTERRGLFHSASRSIFPFYSNGLSKTHSLTTKNVIRPENCDPCGKK